MPVTINGTTGYMAAAIKVGGKNRYHVHRILMPDGSEFEFKEKTEPTSAGVPTTKGSKGSAVSPVSDSSIPENSENSNKQFSLREDTDITYESLLSKPDMKVVMISDANVGSVTRRGVINKALENVRKLGHKDSFGRNVIVNKDTNREIVVGRNSIEHGMPRKHGAMEAIAEHFGEYIQNAIKVNDIVPRNSSTGGYILLGYGVSDDRIPYPAYFVVETLETGEDEVIYFDNLYSANAKK